MSVAWDAILVTKAGRKYRVVISIAGSEHGFSKDSYIQGGKVSYKAILADVDSHVHRDAILGLWKRNLHLICDDRYDWLYSDNPAGPTITLLAVQEEQDRIVGCASIMRRDFVINGKLYPAGVAIDFAVDSEFRVFGPALLLQRTLVEQAWAQGLEFVVGFPNHAAQAVVKRVGYESLGEKARFSQVIRSRSKLREALPRVFPDWLVTAAGRVLDTGLVLRNSLSGGSAIAKVLSRDDELDESWQRLWEKNMEKQGIWGNHGLSYLRWRYVHCPYRDYRFFQLSDKQGELLAYLIFSLKDDMALIEDFRFSDEAWVPELFNKFWSEMHGFGVAAINTGLIFHGGIKLMMTKAGFLLRPLDRGGVVLPSPECAIDLASLISHGDWYITDGEIDL